MQQAIKFSHKYKEKLKETRRKFMKNVLILGETGVGLANSTRPEVAKYIYLAQHGFNVIIMGSKNGVFAQELLQNGIEIIDTQYKRKISFKLIKEIRNVLKSKNIDLVYATASRTISNAIFACLFTRVKLITYRGTTGGLYWHDPSSYLNALNPRVNAVICVSEAVKKNVDSKLISKKTKTIAIYKGHDISWYSAPPNDLTEFGTSVENFNIAFIGNMRPHKGLKYLLEALPSLYELASLHILLIGDKIETEPYVSLIENSNMKDRIHVTGHRSDVPAILQSCDLLIHASTRKEGLPRVVIEALACKTPVIASDNESNLEIIEDGINGFIVPKKDPVAIANKIKLLYNDSLLFNKMKENAQDIIKNGKLSHENTAKQYYEFFNSFF